MNIPAISAAASHRLLAYCHEGAGIGHLRRTLTICSRLSDVYPSMSFLVVTGNLYFTLFEPIDRLDWVKLPTLRKTSDGNYSARHIPAGSRHLIRWRASILRDTVRGFDPTMVLVDKAPLGVCGELASALRWVRKHRPEAKLVCGLRDIEDEPAATIEQWSRLSVQSALKKMFDEVWVYGSQDIFDVAKQYRLNSAVREKMHYMGYVCRVPPTTNGHPRGHSGGASNEIVVTVGGGTDGDYLIRTYLAAAAREVADAGFRTTIVCGPDLPRRSLPELKGMAAAAPAVDWITFDPAFTSRLHAARVIVTMGGYNTLSEAAAFRRPTLVVPRTAPRQEQLIRANLWRSRGIVESADPASLTPQVLAERVVDLARHPSPTPTPDRQLDFGGLDRIAHRVQLLLHAEPHHAAAVCL